MRWGRRVSRPHAHCATLGGHAAPPSACSRPREIGRHALAVLLRAGSPFLQLWWRIRRPTTFGVKALLRLPDGRFLVVRHSYADTRRWSLPGGGYKPSRESPADAAAREVREELGLAIPPDAFHTVRTTITTLEGKHDTLTILTACATDDRLNLSPEIAEGRWVQNLQELGDAPVSKWLLSALID